GRHCDLYATHADPNECTDLQQFETDGAAARLGKRCVVEPDAAYRAQQNVSHGGEPQPQLICSHRGSGGAIRVKIELALLDAVFHIAAGAIHLFVQVLRLALGSLQRGDDEAWIGLAGRELGLAHDPALTAPTVERDPPKVFEAARSLAGPTALRL